MRSMRRLIRSMVIVLALLIPGVVMPRSSVIAQSGGFDELVYGQETGYFFFWDPAILSLQDASSEPGVDHWHLTDGGATVDLWAYLGIGVTTGTCVADALDMIARDPATVSMEMLPIHGGGPPQVIGDTFSEIVLTVDLPSGREKFAIKVECQEPLPGRLLTLEIVHMPARVYNERALESVSIEGFDYYLFLGLHSEELVPTSIPDAAGGTVGSLKSFLPCNTAVFDVMARAGDRGKFVIDPVSFIAIDTDGVLLPVTAVAWSVPEVRRETTLILDPGEMGLVHGVVEVEPNHAFDLYYSAPNGETLFLAPSLWGCGGGGAAPVPIDID